jgi:hypothetical protein
MTAHIASPSRMPPWVPAPDARPDHHHVRDSLVVLLGPLVAIRSYRWNRDRLGRPDRSAVLVSIVAALLVPATISWWTLSS